MLLDTAQKCSRESQTVSNSIRLVDIFSIKKEEKGLMSSIPMSVYSYY